MKEYKDYAKITAHFDLAIEEAIKFGGDVGKHAVLLFETMRKELDTVPAADVVEVRHAKWVSLTPPLLLEEFREMEADKFFMCSECKGECQLVEQDDYYDYCPRCGCKMDKEE